MCQCWLRDWKLQLDFEDKQRKGRSFGFMLNFEVNMIANFRLFLGGVSFAKFYVHITIDGAFPLLVNSWKESLTDNLENAIFLLKFKIGFY